MNTFTKRLASPKTLFDRVRNIVLGDSFNWFFIDNTAYILDGNKVSDVYGYGLYHMVLEENNYTSPFSSIIESLVISTLDINNVKFNKLLRIRIGCNLGRENPHVNPPHVDFYKPHKVALLYLNDSDGDTVLYREKYEVTKNKTGYQQFLEISKFNELERCSPEQYKLFIFDGLHYHSSSTPTNTSRRVVINIDYE